MSTFIEDHGEYSVVRKGSKIYRGQTDAFDIDQKNNTAILARSVISDDRHTYFGLDPENTAINYGITTELEVKKDIRLLNIANADVYRSIYQKADAATQQAMDIAFPLKGNIVYRDSDKNLDYKMLEHICQLDYHGYIQPEMPKINGGTMHSEIAICIPYGIKHVLQPIGKPAIPDPNGRSYYSINQDTKLRKMGQQMEEKRRAARAAARRAAAQIDDDKPLGRRLKF